MAQSRSTEIISTIQRILTIKLAENNSLSPQDEMTDEDLDVIRRTEANAAEANAAEASSEKTA